MLKIPICSVFNDIVVTLVFSTFRLVRVEAFSFTRGTLVTYQFVSQGSDLTVFTIGTTTGQITVNKALDYEQGPRRYTLRVKAIEEGPDGLWSSVDVSTYCVLKNHFKYICRCTTTNYFFMFMGRVVGFYPCTHFVLVRDILSGFCTTHCYLFFGHQN